MKDPATPEEWQEAVDGADALLSFHAARLYGLVTGGPVIDAERCSAILERGKAMGLRPRAGNVERLVRELLA